MLSLESEQLARFYKKSYNLKIGHETIETSLFQEMLRKSFREFLWTISHHKKCIKL